MTHWSLPIKPVSLSDSMKQQRGIGDSNNTGNTKMPAAWAQYTTCSAYALETGGLRTVLNCNEDQIGPEDRRVPFTKDFQGTNKVLVGGMMQG